MQMDRRDWVDHAIQKSVAVILCGGRSRRMNFQDKMNLKMGEVKFLDIIKDKLEFFEDVAISASKAQVETETELEKEKNVIADLYYDVGPFGGIYSVMKAMESTDTEYYFVVSCDMPFIEREIIEILYSHLQEGDDAVIAVTDGKIQPLFSIYSSKIKDAILHQIEIEEYRILDMYDKINTRYVELDARDTLRNINTPEEFAREIENRNTQINNQRNIGKENR